MTANPSFNVLLVEDEPADAHLVRLAFEEGRLLACLHHVGDGVEAFTFLQREGMHADAPAPDVILLDLNMPRMDGREFLRRIKADPVLHGIPVVVLTTSDAESDLAAVYNLGAAGYIVKPLDVDEFIAKVRGTGEYWITMVRLPAR